MSDNLKVRNNENIKNLKSQITSNIYITLQKQDHKIIIQISTCMTEILFLTSILSYICEYMAQE